MPRLVEVLSAGSPVYLDALALVRRLGGEDCDVRVLDMNDPAIATRPRRLGVRSVPAVVFEGVLADCCAGRGPDGAALRRAGLGTS